MAFSSQKLASLTEGEVATVLEIETADLTKIEDGVRGAFTRIKRTCPPPKLAEKFQFVC